MPRLKQYTDGRGYYLAGHIPGVGFSTWQIGKDGLAYLAASGISSSGDSVRIDDLRELIRLDLVGTAAGGTCPAPATPTPQWVTHLADRLIDWSVSGGVEALAKLSCPGAGATVDYRSKCFSTTFLTWIGTLDSDTGLVRLAGTSAAEFETLAVNLAHELEDDPLFGHLVSRGAIGVLWRLARLAGSVAVRLRSGKECPAEWLADLLLSWLFNCVKEYEERGVPPSTKKRQRQPASWTGPQIVWEVDRQEVIAVLPSQILPLIVTRVEWRVGQCEPIYPLVQPHSGRRQIEESVSEPLSPSNVYNVELIPSGEGVTHRWRIYCATESPVILFQTDGRLVDFEDPDPLSPGRYLALVRPQMEPSARNLRGLALEERVPVGPVGWNGWTGWFANLSPGAVVPGYTVSDSSQAVRWTIEPEPDSVVAWLESCPVFLGNLPRILLEPADAFREAVVQVVVEGAGGIGGNSIFLKMGSDISVQGSQGPETSGVADLNTAPQLKHRYGRFRLRCQQTGRLDRSPLVLVFSRLPSMSLEYVPDPILPMVATAIRLAPNAALAGLTAGSDTEVLSQPVGAGPAELIVRSVKPVSAARVHVRSKAKDWEIRVRIGVSRAGLISGNSGFCGWQALPIPGIDLAEIKLDDRLRIEFHSFPITEGGRLVSRISGIGELLVGEPLDQSPIPTLFEIPLHRWRDGFGIGLCGTVQVRCESSWIDAVVLTPAGPKLPVKLPVDTWWQKLTSDLDQAVTQGDGVAAAGLINRCLEEPKAQGHSAIASDLLPLAAARAALVVCPQSDWAEARTAVERLQERKDLPEAKLLSIMFEIRGDEIRKTAGSWSYARVEEVLARLPKDPGADAVQAECWYRLAQSSRVPETGCWESCRTWSQRYLAADTANTSLAFSDTLLLLHFARMMMGADPPAGPVPPGILPGHMKWIDAIRFATAFLRQPWQGRANQEVHLGLSGVVAPSVLCPEDEALLRVVVGIATGSGEAERGWSVVSDLPDGYFYAYPLLRARYARYTGDQNANDEYTRAWAAFLSGEHSNLLDVIAAERL